MPARRTPAIDFEAATCRCAPAFLLPQSGGQHHADAEQRTAHQAGEPDEARPGGPCWLACTLAERATMALKPIIATPMAITIAHVRDQSPMVRKQETAPAQAGALRDGALKITASAKAGPEHGGRAPRCRCPVCRDASARRCPEPRPRLLQRGECLRGWPAVGLTSDRSTSSPIVLRARPLGVLQLGSGSWQWRACLRAPWGATGCWPAAASGTS